MIKELYICFALMQMQNVTNHENICNNLDTINYVSEKYNIEPEILVSIFWIESNFKPNEKSHANACGISQVIPKYTDFYRSLRKKGFSINAAKIKTCKYLSNIKNGIIQGSKAFSFWYHDYANGNIKIALCGYNAGFRCKNESKKERDIIAAKKAKKVYVKMFYDFYFKLNNKISKIKKFNTEAMKRYNKDL